MTPPGEPAPRPLVEVVAVLANMVESALAARPSAVGDERAPDPGREPDHDHLDQREEHVHEHVHEHGRVAGVSMKIERRHLERAAVVYVRQSTLAQVREHTESTARQYALAEQAVALG